MKLEIEKGTNSSKPRSKSCIFPTINTNVLACLDNTDEILIKNKLVDK